MNANDLNANDFSYRSAASARIFHAALNHGVASVHMKYRLESAGSSPEYPKS